MTRRKLGDESRALANLSDTLLPKLISGRTADRRRPLKYPTGSRMRSGSARTSVPYIWPRTLRTGQLPGKLVYLDLNHWIELAKAHSGHPNGRKNLEALDACTKAVVAGEAICPLSFSTYMEISKIQSYRQRRSLREVIETVSRYMVVTSLVIIWTHEVEATLDEAVGSNPKPISCNSYLDWGVLRAMGKNDSLSIMTKDGEDVTSQFRQSYHGGPQAFDEYVAKGHLELNRRTIEGPAAGQEEEELRKLGWNPRSAFKSVERAALDEAAQVARFNQNPRWRCGRIRDVIAAREMANEINEILAKALHERGVSLEGLAPDIKGRRKVFDAMPSFDVVVTLKTEYHRNQNHHWTPNDICDIHCVGNDLALLRCSCN